MFKKFLFAVALVTAGLFASDNQASADHNCYRGGYGGHGSYYRGPSYGYSPYSSAYRSYRVPTRSYFGPGYGYHPRSSYFGPSFGPGFGSPFYGGGSYFGPGRGGISIGFGF